MDFSDFLKYVPKIKQEKLLAEQAHLKMVPIERILDVEKINKSANTVSYTHLTLPTKRIV